MTAPDTAPAVREPARSVGSTPTRLVPTRRVDFGFGEVELPKHFMGDDLVYSHAVVVASCLFPDGEDFFVQSVRNYRDQIDDPELSKQVRGFIGQEAIHGREHRAFNKALGQLGYPTRYLEARVRIILGLFSRFGFKSHQLALTSALEHFTATLAEVLLEEGAVPFDCDVEEVRDLFLWHAMEESEHKSVAFDVFQAVSGSERVRVNMMRVATAGFIAALVSGVAVSLALDPASRDLRRLGRSLAEFRHNPMVSKRRWTQLRKYNKHDFHPDDRDTTQMLDTWRERLFGKDGELNARMKGDGAAA